jgi:hypothetical protein
MARFSPAHPPASHPGAVFSEEIYPDVRQSLVGLDT